VAVKEWPIEIDDTEPPTLYVSTQTAFGTQIIIERLAGGLVVITSEEAPKLAEALLLAAADLEAKTSVATDLSTEEK
jgi:hypothetical protein